MQTASPSSQETPPLEHQVFHAPNAEKELIVCTSEKVIIMALGVRSKKYDYALLECPPEDHSSHLAIKQLRGDSTRKLVGAPLTLCAFQAGIQKELQDVRQGTSFELELMPAYGCNISDQRHHLLYDVRS